MLGCRSARLGTMPPAPRAWATSAAIAHPPQPATKAPTAIADSTCRERHGQRPTGGAGGNRTAAADRDPRPTKRLPSERPLDTICEPFDVGGIDAAAVAALPASSQRIFISNPADSSRECLL